MTENESGKLSHQYSGFDINMVQSFPINYSLLHKILTTTFLPCLLTFSLKWLLVVLEMHEKHRQEEPGDLIQEPLFDATLKCRLS